MAGVSVSASAGVSAAGASPASQSGKSPSVVGSAGVSVPEATSSSQLSRSSASSAGVVWGSGSGWPSAARGAASSGASGSSSAVALAKSPSQSSSVVGSAGVGSAAFDVPPCGPAAPPSDCSHLGRSSSSSASTSQSMSSMEAGAACSVSCGFSLEAKVRSREPVSGDSGVGGCSLSSCCIHGGRVSFSSEVDCGLGVSPGSRGFRRAWQYRQISASAGLGFPHMGQRISWSLISFTIRAVVAQEDAQAGGNGAEGDAQQDAAGARGGRHLN